MTNLNARNNLQEMQSFNARHFDSLLKKGTQIDTKIVFGQNPHT